MGQISAILEPGERDMHTAEILAPASAHVVLHNFYWRWRFAVAAPIDDGQGLITAYDDNLAGLTGLRDNVIIVVCTLLSLLVILTVAFVH
jgi:hypothetical protein